jgi:hypothetical protein
MGVEPSTLDDAGTDENRKIVAYLKATPEYQAAIAKARDDVRKLSIADVKKECVGLAAETRPQRGSNP